jgi:hypothetical protein
MNSAKHIIHFEGEECPRCGATYEVKATRNRDADQFELFSKKLSFTCECGYVFEWSALSKKEFSRQTQS